MADSDIDHDFVEDNQRFLSIDSPFLDFQFYPEEIIEEYVNRMHALLLRTWSFIKGFMICRTGFIQICQCTPICRPFSFLHHHYRIRILRSIVILSRQVFQIMVIYLL